MPSHHATLNTHQLSVSKSYLVTWTEFILKAGCEVVHPVPSYPHFGL